MGCVCSKGKAIEPREGPPEVTVDLPRQIPSHAPALLTKSYSFHGFEKSGESTEANKAVFRTESAMTVPRVDVEGIKPLRENFFIQRDRMEMQKAGKVATFDGRMSSRGRQPPAPRREFTHDKHNGNDSVTATDAAKLEKTVEDFGHQSVDSGADESLSFVLLRIKG